MLFFYTKVGFLNVLLNIVIKLNCILKISAKSDLKLLNRDNVLVKFVGRTGLSVRI